MKLRSLLVLSALAARAVAGAEAITVPAAIKAEGVPEIPKDLMNDVTQYADFRTALLRDWHPTRREILIGTRFGETVQIHRVTMPGGARTQLTFAAERTAGGEYHPGSGDSFVYSKDTGGSEFFQLFRYDNATGRSTLLTDGKSRNNFGSWSRDGALIAFTSTRRNGQESDIWIMNPREPASARMVLQVSTPGWEIHDWSPDGKRLMLTNFVAADTAALHELDIAAGKTRPLTAEKSGIAYYGAHYSPDGRFLYTSTNELSDFIQLARVDLSTGKPQILRPDVKWDCGALDLSEDGKFLAYSVNEDGVDVLHVLDTATLQDVKIPGMPKGVLGNAKWRPKSHEIAFDHTSAKSPSDVYTINVDTGKLERWTTSETGGLNPELFVEPEIIRWKSFDGLSISGFMYKPPARFSGPRPVLINIHGGPESQFQPGFLNRTNYLINELGITLIYPNVRGSFGYGKKFLSLDNGEKREDSVKDIGALLDWIAQRPDLDAKKVMVTGGSYGGYMSLASMTHYNDRLRGAVEIVGIANFVTFLERTEAYRRDLRRVEYGDERDPKMRDFLFTISPVKNVKKITKPMLIMQGRNDPRVPYTESEQMVEAIRSNGGPVWYVLAADEGHGFFKKSNQDYQFAATIAFLKQHLLQ